MKKHQPWYAREMHLFSVPQAEMVSLIKNLSVMLAAGLGVSESFGVLVDQSKGAVRRMMVSVSARLSAGERFSQALAHVPGVFSPVFLNAVKAGEQSGTLSQNLSHVAVQLEQELSLKRHVHSALVYPIIVVCATMVLGLLLATFVLPELASVFASLHTKLPWSTRVLLWLADTFARDGYWLTPVLFFLMIGLGILLRARRIFPLTHALLLRLPGLGGFFHTVERAHFCRGLGTLLESGIPIQEALKIQAQAMDNYYYRKSALSMVEQVASGQGLGEILAKEPDLYPVMIQRMVGAGERAGGLDQLLFFLARFYEEDVSLKAKNLSSMIEPILLFVIGLAVAFVAFAIFTPIYSITSHFAL